MGSLRSINSQSVKEQRRIESLIRKGMALSGLTEKDFMAGVHELIRRYPGKLPDSVGLTEFALAVACGVWETHRSAQNELRELFGLPECRFSTSPLFYPVEILGRVRKHRCIRCEWQDDAICLRSEGEDAIPAECPGFKKRRKRGTRSRSESR
jgi:hypothetical protein